MPAQTEWRGKGSRPVVPRVHIYNVCVTPCALRGLITLVTLRGLIPRAESHSLTFSHPPSLYKFPVIKSHASSPQDLSRLPSSHHMGDQDVRSAYGRGRERSDDHHGQYGYEMTSIDVSLFVAY